MAIVAGAGGALGRATAVTLAARGLTVVAVDRNERGLRELPGDVRAEMADATDPAAAHSLIDRIAGEAGSEVRLYHALPVIIDTARRLGRGRSEPSPRSDPGPVGTIGPVFPQIGEAKRICRACRRRPRAWPGDSITGIK